MVCFNMTGYACGCCKFLPAGSAAELQLREHAAATQQALPRVVGVGVSLVGGRCSPQRRKSTCTMCFWYQLRLLCVHAGALDGVHGRLAVLLADPATGLPHIAAELAVAAGARGDADVEAAMRTGLGRLLARSSPGFKVRFSSTWNPGNSGSRSLNPIWLSRTAGASHWPWLIGKPRSCHAAIASRPSCWI